MGLLSRLLPSFVGPALLEGSDVEGEGGKVFLSNGHCPPKAAILKQQNSIFSSKLSPISPTYKTDGTWGTELAHLVSHVHPLATGAPSPNPVRAPAYGQEPSGKTSSCCRLILSLILNLNGEEIGL